MSLNQSRLPVSEAELSPQNVFSICMFTSIKSQFFFKYLFYMLLNFLI